MSMDALKDKLKELHSTLETAETPDAELMQLLQQLDTDIHSLVVKNANEMPNEVPATEGVVTRTQENFLKFAVQHPHLEPVLRELTDMLASIGI